MSKKLLFFTIALIIALPLAFADEGVVSVNGFDIKFSSQNISVTKMSFDQNTLSLNININTQQDGSISIELPRKLLDSRISNSDDEFYLLVDGKESIYEETNSSTATRILDIAVHSDSKKITIIGTETKSSVQSTSMSTPTAEQKKGCLIATAAFGTELAPQVQLLREIRDEVLYNTGSGTAFMAGFNDFYYTFSPTVSDWERQNPLFKEAVKTTITPMLSILSILNYVDVDSEQEMLGYGIGVVLLNIGMYFVVPAIVIVKLREKFRKL